MSKQQEGKKKKNAVASFVEGVEDVQQHLIFGRFSEAEMITQLKTFAMDPCNPQFAQNNSRPLWNQIATLRKVMFLEASERPWRKRKLEQFVRDKLKVPADIPLPNQQSKGKLGKRQLSQMSCLLNSIDSTQGHDAKSIFDYHTSSSLVTFDGDLPEKHLATACSIVDYVEDLNYRLKGLSETIDSDESVYGSNQLSPENSTPDDAPPLGISKAIHCFRSPVTDGEHKRNLETPRRSIRLLNFIGDNHQRKAIPVGFRFQADIPEWNGPEDRSILIAEYKSNTDSFKWLESPVWPIENGNMKSTRRKVGKGRLDSCSCATPGSVDCTKRHILKNRLQLLSDLGPAFFSWKFDEMGEQVSETWSVKEQQTFESLMKRRPPSIKKRFWERAPKSFSNKHRKDIVNYYYNVYLPHQMSLLTSSPTSKQINTDDEEEDEEEEEEEEENISYMGVQKRSKGRRINTAKAVSTKYLRSS